MSVTLRQFAELTEFLLEKEKRELTRELTLTAAQNLPCASPEERFQLADFTRATLYRAKYYDESVSWAREACRLAPQNPQAAYQLSQSLCASLREAEAEQILRALIAAFPEQTFLLIDLSIALFFQNKFDEAQGLLESLLERLPPNHPERQIATFNLHWHWMRKGRFKDSMNVFLGREGGGSHFSHFIRPELKPTHDLRGKRVLVLHHDGGAGDEIVNVRFVKYLAARGAHVIWRTRHRFGSLFERVEGMGQVVGVEDSRDPQTLDFDYWISAGTIVRFLNFDLPDVSREPYLFADPAHIAKWSRLIPDRGKLRVGLRWQGTMSTDLDMHRSVPFAEYRKLLNLPDVEFYLIQRDSGLEEVLPTDPVTDLSRELQTWEDTAAAMHCLDLIVTNCTSIAHLSGALGKKTWLYTPLGCFYVWAPPGNTSHWYKDVRLFRQTRRRDWSNVTQEVREALASSVSRSDGARSRSMPTAFPPSL